jgi:hypothetical protein
MSLMLASALALVRGWTRLYTARMERPLRDARRAEIESDLWELHEDARRRGATPELIALHMFARLVGGVVDDLRWRAEQGIDPAVIVGPALWAMAVASVLMLWTIVSALQTREPPLSPVGSNTLVRMLYPVRLYPAPPAPPPMPSTSDLIVVHVNLEIAPPLPPPPPKPPTTRN